MRCFKHSEVDAWNGFSRMIEPQVARNLTEFNHRSCYYLSNWILYTYFIDLTKITNWIIIFVTSRLDNFRRLNELNPEKLYYSFVSPKKFLEGRQLLSQSARRLLWMVNFLMHIMISILEDTFVFPIIFKVISAIFIRFFKFSKFTCQY